MTVVGSPNARSNLLVDQNGWRVADPSNQSIGIRLPSRADRVVWALGLNAPRSGFQRYQPSHPPEEVCNFWLDFSFIAPFGVGLTSGALAIFTNAATPVAADGDWVKGAVQVFGRALYAQLGGGVSGKDYQLRWTAVDGMGNTWPRTALILCAETS